MERKRRAPVAAVPLALSTVVCLAAAMSACSSPDDTPQLRVEVVATRAHDTAAFTEGLEADGDTLYESTGLSGQSFVRASKLSDGSELARADLPAPCSARASPAPETCSGKSPIRTTSPSPAIRKP